MITDSYKIFWHLAVSNSGWDKLKFYYNKKLVLSTGRGAGQRFRNLVYERVGGRSFSGEKARWSNGEDAKASGRTFGEAWGRDFRGPKKTGPSL